MYIAFEGIEGSGKSLQIKLLENFFKQNRYKYIITKEPGSTAIGKQIRKILLSSKNSKISILTELFLYFADRAQHYEEIIITNYGKRIIISDRSMYSTFAYQGYGRGIDIDILKKLNKIATKEIEPDLVILLDCPVEIGLKRALDREKTLDFARFELESFEFHNKVRKGYLELSKKNNWLVIDATLKPKKIYNIITEFIERNYERIIKNFIEE